MGGWVGPRTGLGTLETTESFVPAGNRRMIPQLSNLQPSHNTGYAIPAPFIESSILISITHLPLGLETGSFLSDLPTKILDKFLISHTYWSIYIYYD